MRTAHTTYQPQKVVRCASVLVATIAVAVAATASHAASGTATAPAISASRDTNVATSALQLDRAKVSRSRRTWSYGWPVKPFGRQHPVRAFLDDPRIGSKGGESFHFGIDIAVPDGTPVYAVVAGTVWFNNPQAIAVVAREGSRSFGYWHVTPVVKSHQVVAHHQLIAYVAKGWGHVHFAETRGGVYVNPLRNGGLGPYTDHTVPTVDSVHQYGSALAVVAHDTPDPAVPGRWAGEPVTPALIRWRIVRSGARVAWKTAADFRTTLLDNAAFDRIYTPETRQNHEGEAGRFSFYLSRTARLLGVTIQVEVSDTAGNRAVYTATAAAVDGQL